MGVKPSKYMEKNGFSALIKASNPNRNSTSISKKATSSNQQKYQPAYNAVSYIFKAGIFKTLDKETISYSAFQLLGQGSFGIVYLARTNKDDLVAVKCKLPLNDFNLMQKSNMLFRGELEALFNLKHQNIVRLLGVEFEHNEVSSLIMEHIVGEPLDKFIYRNRTLNENTIQLFTKQTVEAIKYMHSKFVMHRDIKSSNIMLVSNTWIKLIDFGMSKRLHVNGIGNNHSTSTMVGTVPFMAPEVRNFQSYNCKADIFSIGALIYEMANGDPFVRVAHEYITETLILSQVRGVVNVPSLSSIANSFMQSCLTQDANSRPSASVLLTHKFMKNVHVPSQPK